MPEKKLRVGVIGTGMIANAAHLPAFENVGDRMELVAVADLRLQSAQDTAERFKIPYVYDDPQKMLDEMDLDIVSICTPNNYHKKWSVAAFRAGCHVACEKPAATTYNDAAEMFAEAEKAGKNLFVTQTMRFSDMIISAKRIIDAGRVGEPYFGEISIIRRRGVPTWGYFHRKEFNFGGPFCDIGVHFLDSLLYLTDNPKIKSVHGKAWAKIANQNEDIETSLAESGAFQGVFTPIEYNNDEFSVEDMSAGLIRFENDLLVNFKFSWAVNISNGEYMHIAGTKGGIQIMPDMKVLTNQDGFQVEIFPHQIVRKEYAGVTAFTGHFKVMEHILDVLDGKCEYIIKKDEVLNTTGAIEAFYLSSEQDRDVLISELDGYR